MDLTGNPRINPEALTVARRAAAPGERVLWAGRASGLRWPGQGVLYPAGLTVVYAAVMAEPVLSDLDRHLARWPFLLAMAAPILIFAALTAVALWVERRETGGVYAVTDRRVLILGKTGAVIAAVGLDRADEFRAVGRTLHLGGIDAAIRDGRTDHDGGLARFEALPRLRGLADAKGVRALIRRAAAA